MRHSIDNPIRKYDQVVEDLKNPAIKLDTLARYAQGQNPMVPEFLALAEIKRRQNLVARSPVPAPTTVREDLVRAAAPQPVAPMGLPGMQIPQGVAALPSGIDEKAYAGGGIVAFAGDKGSQVEEDPEGLGYFERFKRYVNNLGGGVIPRQGAAVNATPSQIEGARTGRTPSANMLSADADNQAGGFYGGKKPTLDQFEAAHPNINWNGTPAPESKEKPGRKASDAAKELGITQVEPKEDMFGKYEKMFNEQAAAAKAQREQDKWMRLLEAGLGIMGGTSQHALVNIGQGATAAAKGYAQDKAAAQKEERQNVMDLMNLGMKKEEAAREAEKIAMTKELYGAHGRYYDAAAKAAGQRAAGAGAGTKLQIAQEKNVTNLIAKWMNSGEGIGKSPEELRDLAIRALGYNNPGATGPVAVGSWSPKGGFSPTGT